MTTDSPSARSATTDIVDSPVWCLRHNITATFEQVISQGELRAAVDDQRIDAGLDVRMQAAPPKAPYVRLEPQPPAIQIFVSYLEGLWAFIYGLLVQQEHEMRRAMQAWPGHAPDYPEFSAATRERAARLFEWARSLPAGYTAWPRDLPSPQIHTGDEERNLAGKVNSIFQSAIGWQLHHELAHAIYEHVMSGTDAEILQQEKEADLVAYARFIDHFPPESPLLGYAILAPHLYALVLARTQEGLFAKRHLHVHHRLAHALAHLGYRDPRMQDYFGSMCVHALQIFCVEHGIDQDLAGPQFERVDDLLQHLVDRLDVPPH